MRQASPRGLTQIPGRFSSSFIAYRECRTFFVRVALIFHDLEVLLRVSRERHADREGLGEQLGILDGRGVGDRVGTCSCEMLYDVQVAAMEVPGAVEPGLVIEIRDVDY